MSECWGGFVASDWRREQIGVGVTRCPDDPDAMPPMLVFDVPTEDEVRAAILAGRDRGTIILSSSPSVQWAPTR